MRRTNWGPVIIDALICEHGKYEPQPGELVSRCTACDEIVKTEIQKVVINEQVKASFMQIDSEQIQIAKQKWWNRIACLFKGHDIVAWEEPLNHTAIEVEFWECDRCGEFLGVGDVKGM